MVPEGASREGGPAGEGAGPACMLMSWAAASLRTGAVAAGRAGAARQPSACRPAPPSFLWAPRPAPPPPRLGRAPLQRMPGAPCIRGPGQPLRVGNPGGGGAC